MLWCDLNTVVKMQYGSNLEVIDEQPTKQMEHAASEQFEIMAGRFI